MSLFDDQGQPTDRTARQMYGQFVDMTAREIADSLARLHAATPSMRPEFGVKRVAGSPDMTSYAVSDDGWLIDGVLATEVTFARLDQRSRDLLLRLAAAIVNHASSIYYLWLVEGAATAQQTSEAEWLQGYINGLELDYRVLPATEDDVRAAHGGPTIDWFTDPDVRPQS